MNWRVDKQIAVYLYNGMLLNNEKYMFAAAICIHLYTDTDEAGRHVAQGKPL